MITHVHTLVELLFLENTGATVARLVDHEVAIECILTSFPVFRLWGTNYYH